MLRPRKDAPAGGRQRRTEVGVGEDDVTAVGATAPERDPDPYEPPKIELLGTVGALTRGPVGVGGDLDGMVISF